MSLKYVNYDINNIYFWYFQYQQAVITLVFCITFIFQTRSRACLKNHSCNLHVPICGIFCLHSVDVARYAALIQAKSPTNCNAHLTESIFQTRSRSSKKRIVISLILFRCAKRLILPNKTNLLENELARLWSKFRSTKWQNSNL